jgi:hypothetical protein
VCEYSFSDFVSTFLFIIQQPLPRRFVFYSVGTGTVRSDSLAGLQHEGSNLEELLLAGNFWIDITSPTDSEMKTISKVYFSPTEFCFLLWAMFFSDHSNDSFGINPFLQIGVWYTSSYNRGYSYRRIP